MVAEFNTPAFDPNFGRSPIAVGDLKADVWLVRKAAGEMTESRI
ncbi:MAG: hypothetical protein AAGD40_08185 [Pseudomonadota bacterium]